MDVANVCTEVSIVREGFGNAQVDLDTSYQATWRYAHGKNMSLDL